MNTHDPKQVIEDLRNHLAMHDRRLSFLFGAGTSSAVNVSSMSSIGEKPKHQPLIPGIEGLTEICFKAVCDMGVIQSTAWSKLVNQCMNDCCPANVEQLLTRIRTKIDAIGEGETLLGLDKTKLIEMEKMICAAIAKTVNPPKKIIPSFLPHHEFASWVKKVNRTVPIEVFTTNYDLLLEMTLESARVPVFDGFVGTHQPFFYPECLDDEDLLPKANWIRLWKLHGSVNWVLEDKPEGKRIIRSTPSESGEMILPSHRKYDESRKQPYIGYIDRLSRLLNSAHSLLITCGYSFGDDHINAILYSAIDTKKTTNIYALQYLDLKEGDELVKTALRHPNFTVIGPNGGVISGLWGLWQLTQPVDDKTCSFMDDAFDSNALPEDKGSPAAASSDLTGRMRLGDFNWFCRFLNSMGVDIQ